jgi:ParB family chromosome partitioning protein
MLKRIALDLIERNADQPRQFFDAKALQELADSIANNGLMQPITVRPVQKDGGTVYEIVAGERRWRAHCLLRDQGKLPDGSILARVRKMDEEERDIQAIVENLSRADITPLEEARAFKRMLDRGMTEQELATKLGLRQAWRVSERVRLLNLSPEITKLYESGNLSGDAAFEIAKLERHADQTKIVQMISRGQLTGWKAIKAAVAAINEGLSQTDIFGDAPKVSEEEVATINRMEAKIERVAEMVASGWKDGACVIATKVSRDRARLMADKLAAIRQHVRQMENELRAAAAQADLVLGNEEAA